MRPDPDSLTEAVDLLALWYARWQGYVSGTPHDMHLRTRALLEAHGRPPQKPAWHERPRG